MSETNPSQPINQERRNFLALVPVGACAGIAAVLGRAAQLALQPPATTQAATQNALAKWTTVGKLTELNGAEPIQRNLQVERAVGWTAAAEDYTVFVLPQTEHQVVSAICPHEGCPVLWDAAAKTFLCPCHDSRFSAGGVHLSGPSRGDLVKLTSQVADGTLQVQIPL